MPSPRTCLKCGHNNPQAQQTDLEACPNCGAIYSRVEQAAAAGRLRPPSSRFADSALIPDIVKAAANPSPTVPTAATAPAMTQRHVQAAQAVPFIDLLRGQSNYPTFRGLVKLFAWVGYIVWGIGALVAVIAAFAAGLPGAAIGALVVGPLMIVLTRVFHEAALMMADASDAAVRTAEQGHK